MARARNIKPSLFKNEILGEADPLLTILFTGLWCLADREGRLEDRPKRIKAEIFPYRELPDFNGYLTELERLGFIDRYEASGEGVIQIVNFAKHQSPHKTEKASDLPAKAVNPGLSGNPVKAPLDNGGATVKESLIPDSLIPEERGASSPNPKRFQKPSLDQLVEAFEGKVSSPRAEAQKFLNFYESNGWKVGKNKMQSWPHAVGGWAQRARDEKPSPSGTGGLEV